MKAKWLIELDLFSDTESDLINAIKNSGREVNTIKYIPFDDNFISNKCNKLFNSEDCVIFYGSLNLGKKFKKMSYIPGVYLNNVALECKSYYPVFGDELLHSNYIMMPFGDLIRRKEFIFNHFGDRIFIRPNSGYKEFTGNVLDKNNFEYGIELASFYDVSPDLLVIVSDAKDIQKEWRFVIVNQEVVSGSLYRDWTDGGENIERGCTTKDLVLLHSKSVKEYCSDEKAFEYAKKVAKLYNPDVAWTLDVTLTESGEYKTIEIGCFSCAGLYGNDLDKVVKAVSEASENEWEEYQI